MVIFIVFIASNLALINSSVALSHVLSQDGLPRLNLPLSQRHRVHLSLLAHPALQEHPVIPELML